MLPVRGPVTPAFPGPSPAPLTPPETDLPAPESPALAPHPGLDRRTASGSAAEQALALYRAVFVRSTEPIAIIEVRKP